VCSESKLGDPMCIFDKPGCSIQSIQIFENAVSSIQMALGDFASPEKERAISAVRNMHAGILLLFKAKLSAFSPADSNDVLIKKNIRPQKTPEGKILFVGYGKKTVDVADIQERFKSLGIPTDWKRFQKINDARNDVEHHFTTLHPDAIKGMISDTFMIIRDFITDQLMADPREELGDAAWGTLLSVSEVFEKERKECKERMESIDWESSALSEAICDLTCLDCGSPLLSPAGAGRDHGVTCRSCGKLEPFESFAERALLQNLGGQNHVAVQDGGEEVLITCPFCFQEGYVVEEKCCALCGESCHHTCDMCSNEIPVCELSDGRLCGYCSHVLSKDD